MDIEPPIAKTAESPTISDITLDPETNSFRYALPTTELEKV